MREHNERKEDTMQYFIVKVASIIGVIGAIGGGFFWLGGTRFADKELNTSQHQEIKQDVLLLKQNIEYIKDGVKEIREAVKH